VDDLTLAEKVARTVALDSELRAIWGHGRVYSSVHHQTHMDVHNSASSGETASRTADSWIVSAYVGEQFRSTQMFAPADLECSACRNLVTEAAIHEERRHVAK
jgi:hypothetical protein